MRIIAFLGLLLVACSAVAGERYDFSLPGGSDSPHHWIVIISRPAGTITKTPGHAMVELGWEDPKASVTDRAVWGFYPERASFGAVPGKLVDDLKSGGLAKETVIVSAAVSKQAFDRANAVVTTWKTKPPEYSLFTGKNCIDFVAAVAAAVGMHTPDHSVMQFPTDYLRALGKANKKRKL